jgi:hypothetical protein
MDVFSFQGLQNGFGEARRDDERTIRLAVKTRAGLGGEFFGVRPGEGGQTTVVRRDGGGNRRLTALNERIRDGNGGLPQTIRARFATRTLRKTPAMNSRSPGRNNTSSTIDAAHIATCFIKNHLRL